MTYCLVQPKSTFGNPGLICAKGTLAEMQAQKQSGQHIVLISHGHLYRYDVGGECLYATFAGRDFSGADGVTVYVDTCGT